MRILRRVALLAAAVMGAACGGAGGGDGYGPTTPTANGPVSSSTNQITIANLTFTPTTVTVPVGTTVTWQWNDCSSDGYGGYAGCVSHNVSFDDGSSIASATQSTGTFSRTFATAGTFKYHCTIHGAPMNGQVVVK
jgi:plastocyanin